MKPTSGFHSCLRNDSQRAQVSLRHGLRTGTHHHTTGRHFPDQQMGTAGSGTGQQETPTDRLPVQNFIGGMVKVDYQKRNLLGLHRACFSLKVPTQQLFITSFLLLEKITWLAQQHIPTMNFYLSVYFQLPWTESFTISHHYCLHHTPAHGLLFNCIWHPGVCTVIVLSGNDMQRSCSSGTHSMQTATPKHTREMVRAQLLTYVIHLFNGKRYLPYFKKSKANSSNVTEFLNRKLA